MAMHLVWKGRQLIIYLFNTVWILLISKVVFLHMYMYSVCSYFYVCARVWVCAHECVDAQSQLWMSTQLLYFIYWGRVSCWPWNSLLPGNGVSYQVLGLQSTSAPVLTWVLGPDSGRSCLLRKLIQWDIFPTLQFLVILLLLVLFYIAILVITVFCKSKHLKWKRKGFISIEFPEFSSMYNTKQNVNIY